MLYASPTVIWRDHSGRPVSASKARTASEVSVGGSEWLSPVVT
jgi:hypothetical protein